MPNPKPTSTVIQDSIPLPSAQPPEVDYLQHRYRAYEDSQVTYDSGSREFVPQPFRTRTISLDLEPRPVGQLLADSTDSFHKAVERLKANKKCKTESEIATFKFENCENWGDVIEHVQNAEKKYASDKSLKDKVRGLFRKVSDNGRSIQSFVGLLPDGEYKTLCGGLTLILTAMVAHSDIRKKMAELMEKLPELVQDTEEYLEIYGSEQLRRLAELLYADIMQTLEYIVEWYLQKSWERSLKALGKNTNYGDRCDALLNKIGNSRSSMEKEWTRCGHKTLKSMRGTLIQIQSAILETLEAATDSRECMRSVEASLEDMKKGIQEGGQEWQKTLQAQVMSFNELRKMLADGRKIAEWKQEKVQQAEEYNRELAEWRDRTNAMSYDPKKLAKILNLSLKKERHLEDIGAVQAKSLEGSLKFQKRARWVARHPVFLQEWYKSRQSSLLVVQGRSDYESRSPISFLASLLYQELKGDKDVLVLPFFCGLHSGDRFDKSGKTSGPMHMCRSLLAQILSIKSIDWSGGDNGLPMLPLPSDQVVELSQGSFAAYLKLICNLIARLQGIYRAIFILIDGLDWYDVTWEKEIRKVDESFRGLVSEDESPGVLKWLLQASMGVFSERGTASPHPQSSRQGGYSENRHAGSGLNVGLRFPQKIPVTRESPAESDSAGRKQTRLGSVVNACPRLYRSPSVGEALSGTRPGCWGQSGKIFATI
ncbi:hypothetical protein BDV96DRAFT_593310 [Lophiotrema nucula]|uniref:DUF7708 domain-containing protein n=1 Tax=Lophiotrema nucula TaxID=690887 RepID=A0A6A5ZX05_9PLEO|nr:hypothetical protein BDV96DRAFT_593310 [Lophiotrema nucula]